MRRALDRIAFRDLPTMAHTINSDILHDLIKTGKKALRGNSNDAEHDALYEIVEMLETLHAEAQKKSKRPDAKSP